jgi:hypothetical protein
VRESLGIAAGLALIAWILVDAFEAIVLPRRVTRRFRPTRLFYAGTWRPWSALARRMRPGKRHESFLGIFGPLSMLLLLGCWATGMLLGFALLLWSASRFHGDGASFAASFYMSGETFFTLGLGDVTPHTSAARATTVLEAGIGFAFLALVVGYLPVLYGAFSKREVVISQLDSRAGSPPSALELLRRYKDAPAELRDLLKQVESWTAELMESHLSYPVLCYYRSQHDNQSWLAALTTVLDACSILLASGKREGDATHAQARFTFALARHAVADLAQVLSRKPLPPEFERLPPEVLERLTGAGCLAPDPSAAERLKDYRRMYEPYVNALAVYLQMPLPRFDGAPKSVENWKTSAWGRIASEPGAAADAEHRD